MSLVTIIWSMIASACTTLAGIHLLIWRRNHSAWASLLFCLTAVSTAAFAFCELQMMQAETPEEFATTLKWAHVPVWLVTISLVWFVRLYLRAGRTWLAWVVSGVRTLALLLNFLVGQNLNYREITYLRHIRFLGESVSLAVGVPNPWMVVGQSSLMILLIFASDASVTAWRKGDRRRVLTVGGSIVFFTFVSICQSVLVFWGVIHTPIMASLSFMGLVTVMGYELSRDVFRASQLAGELKESRDGLHENEQRLRLAVEAANFGIWIRELARSEVWASDKWRELFGFTPSEPLDIESIQQRLYPDDREAIQQVLTMALAGGGSYETEFRLMLPDGGLRWISSYGRVEFDATGRPVRVRGISRDVTARKQAEQETVLLRREVAHVARVTMMGQLASALAHEINQPLGAILRNAEAAELFMQDASPDLDEIRAIVADIRKDDQRAGAVIDRMRALLKRQPINSRVLDMGELVGDVGSLVQADAAARHVKLEVDVPGDLPPVRGDRVHLQQVLLNVILNGMDAISGAGDGERRIRIIALLNGPKTVEIAVSDTGSGIPADTLAHIFDPFFTTKSNGMGMGLPISRTIIEAHGGRFWAENNSTGGATFRFTLPIAEEVAAK
jgi:two-component system, LuxR family, sensor kinase FixL